MTRFLLLCSLVVAATAGTARAQSQLPASITEQVSMTTTRDGNLILWIGDAQLSGGDGDNAWEFFADRIEFYVDESRLVATGSVVFMSGGARIAAERAEFNADDFTGTFFDARGSNLLVEDVVQSMFGTSEPEMQFWGELMEKTGPRTYKLTRGGFTSCVQPTPRWEVQAGSVTMNLDRYALLRSAVLKVKGVPLFYLPILYYPIQEDDRATGILMPTYGASTIRGQSISNAFFWAINRSHDATLFHDLFTSTGQAYGGEYRYVAGPGSQGNAETYFLNERETTLTDQFGPGTGESAFPARQSYQVRGNARHRVSDSITARGQIDYFSDVTVQQTYQTNVFEASNSSRSFGGNVTGSWGAYTLSGTGDVAETFFGADDASQYGSGPRVSFNQSERSLLGSPVYFGFTSEYANLLRRSRFGDEEVNSGLNRIDVSPLVRVPFTKWPFLTVNSSVAWRQTYWTESIDELGAQVDTGIGRSFIDMQALITGPVFVKVWDTPGSSYSERMKHVIEPQLSVQRVTAVDNFDQIVQLEGTDSIVGNVTQIRYGLNNRLYARRAEGGGAAVAQEILTVTLEQSYYTDENAANFDRQFRTSFQGESSAPSKFSPVAITARANPTNLLSGTFRAEYDTQFWTFRTIGADANIEIGGWFQQVTGWSQRRFVEGLRGFDVRDNLDHYVNSFTNLKTSDDSMGGVYQFNYDVLGGRFLQQRIVWYYNAQCCGVAFEYQSYNLEGLGTRVRVAQDRRFNLSFTLAGLSTFSNMLGAFGVGTGAGEFR
jgi:LPS-assembly protein